MKPLPAIAMLALLTGTTCAGATVAGTTGAGATGASAQQAAPSGDLPAVADGKLDTATFAKTLASANRLEIDSSKLAEEKGVAADVKAFAALMIEDHTKAAEDFKATLQNSHARYKFVFAHHVTGGQLRRQGAPAAYVRGGANAAPYFEWGGLNADGSYGFDAQRPGWGVPIHQLMLDNGVTAFFHGHDHEYAYEVVDGIVYQEMPSPSMMGPGFNLYSESDPNTKKVLPNAGHLRVTVDAARVTVDYVKAEVGPGAAGNGQVVYSYTIEAPGR